MLNILRQVKLLTLILTTRSTRTTRTHVLLAILTLKFITILLHVTIFATKITLNTTFTAILLHLNSISNHRNIATTTGITILRDLVVWYTIIVTTTIHLFTTKVATTKVSTTKTTTLLHTTTRLLTIILTLITTTMLTTTLLPILINIVIQTLRKYNCRTQSLRLLQQNHLFSLWFQTFNIHVQLQFTT